MTGAPLPNAVRPLVAGLLVLLVLAASAGARGPVAQGGAPGPSELHGPSSSPASSSAAGATPGAVADPVAVGPPVQGEVGPRGPAEQQTVPSPSAQAPEVDAPAAAPGTKAAARPTPASDAHVPVPASERPEVVIKAILGLLALLGLAYVGGNPRVVQLERRLGIAQVVTAGFPFVLLGVVARLPAVSILSDDVLEELTPALRVALGWIGLVVGLRFDARLLKGLPRGAGFVVLLSTTVPLFLVVASCGLFLTSIEGTRVEDLWSSSLLRDALVLGLAGVITSRSAVRIASLPAKSVLYRLVLLEEFVGILGLAIVAAVFRPSGPEVSWQVPGAAWFLLTVGLGTTIGLLAHAILNGARGQADLLVMILGTVSFAAGAAGLLHVSPVVVAFLAGVVLANFSGDYLPNVREALERMERPVYLLALVVVGALWRLDDWRGWVLVPLFAGMRLCGKIAAVRLSTGGAGAGLLGLEERRALAISPIGSLALAIVVSVRLLYPESSISPIVSAVVGGSVLTELVVQVLTPRPSARAVKGRGPMLEGESS